MIANFGLLQVPDIGGAFRQGMEQGRALREEQNRKNALMAYNANPGDVAAQNALLSVDPRMGMQMIGFNQDRAEAERNRVYQDRQRERDDLTFTQEQRRRALELAGRAASSAQTPEQWDANVDWLAANVDPEVAAYKGRFGDREMILGLIKEEIDASTPAIIRTLQAAGIDPKSDEGRRLIAGSISNSPEAVAARVEVKQAVPGKAPSAGRGGGRGSAKLPSGFILD